MSASALDVQESLGGLGTVGPGFNTGTSQPASSSSGGITSALGDIGSGLLGSIGSGLSSFGSFLPEVGLGLAEANSAQSDAKAQSAQLASLGQPYVAAGNAGLAPAAAAIGAQNTATIGQDASLNSIATQAFNNYQTGTLSAGDQQSLDAQIAQQKQQLRQSLGSNVDSSVLASYDAQIDAQATTTKQNLLTQQYQVGVQAQQEVQTTFTNMFNQSISLGQTGMQPIIDAVQLAVQSDAAIADALQGLLGSVAQAYGKSIAGSGGSGGAAAGGAAGAASSLSKLINPTKSLINNLTSGGSAGVDTSSLSGDVSSYLGGSGASSAFTSLSPSAGFTTSDFFGGGDASSLGLGTGDGASTFDSLTSDLNFSSAGGEAATGSTAAAAQSGSSSATGLASTGTGIGSSLVEGLSIAGAVLSAYNEVKNWSSGATGSDALQGAETGAAIGTAVAPGIGTVIGGVIGGVVGAASSLFGGGKQSVGDAEWRAFSKNPNVNPTSISDADMQHIFGGGYTSNINGGLKTLNAALAKKYGNQNSEQGQAWNYNNFIKDTVSQAQKAGQITAGMSPSDIYTKIIQPATASEFGSAAASSVPASFAKVVGALGYKVAADDAAGTDAGYTTAKYKYGT